MSFYAKVVKDNNHPDYGFIDTVQGGRRYSCLHSSYSFIFHFSRWIAVSNFLSILDNVWFRELATLLTSYKVGFT